jgi:hypothetical protein
MTKISAGTRFIALTSNILETVNPVIIVMTPPQALKSAIIVEFITGKIAFARKKLASKTSTCGTHITLCA